MNSALRRGLRPVAVLFTALCVLLLPTAPAVPQLFGPFTVDKERELGRQFNLLVRTQMPMVEDPEVTGYVQALTERLAAGMPPQPWPMTTGVIRKSIMNAFAGPAGHMFVFTGLIAHMEHESDLAGVMAHELAHVSQRHIASRMEKGQAVSIASMLGMLAGALVGGDAGQGLAMGSLAAGQSAMLSYSRADEREADDVGLAYLVRAGYQPQGLVRSFELLRRKSFNLGSLVPSYLKTHPGLDERIGTLEDRISTLPADIRNRPERDQTFHRVRMLVRARYLDSQQSLAFFAKPSSCLDHIGRGIALERVNRMQEANQSFKRALACGDSDPLVLREAGRFAFTSGDFDRAGILLQKAILLNPRDLVSLYFYARILGESGQPDKAIDYMQRVQRAVPRDAEVREHLGRLYAQNGNLFQGHLQLAYAGLYSGNRRLMRMNADKARGLATTDKQRRQLEAFETGRKELEELL